MYWCGECELNRRGRQSDNCLMVHIGSEGATSIGMAPTHDDDVVRSFIERLDRDELNGHLSVELPKLTYAQLLRVGMILAERIEKELGQK